MRQRGEHLQIAVWDTGPGITSQQRHRIFDAFYRGQNTRVEGVGLGLSVAKRMSEQLHCELKLNSIEGRGSCFMVTVPMGAAAQVSQRQAAQEEGTPSEQLTLVCVDDDPENLSALRDYWKMAVPSKPLRAAPRHCNTWLPPSTHGVLLDYQLVMTNTTGLHW